MAIEGVIRQRNGKTFVMYAYTLSTEPVRRILWYPVIESYSNRYNMQRPEEGDIARHESGEGANWTVSRPPSAGGGAAGRVVVEDNAEVTEVGVEPPRAGGKQLRWSTEGRWEKLMAKGWVPAGEGGPGDPTAPAAAKEKKPRARRAAASSPSSPSSGEPKSSAQLEREIQEALASGGKL